MNLANRVRRAGPGFLLGALAGFALCELGLADVMTGAPQNATMTIAFAILGGVLAAAGLTRAVAGASAAAAVLYVLVAITPIAGALSRSWVRRDVVRGSADAVVSLSSGVLPSGALDEYGIDRLLTAAGVARRFGVSRIVTTRVHQDYGRLRVWSDSGQREIVGLAGLVAGWTVLDQVQSTHDEAVRAAERLQPLGVRAIVLVTSPMHTRRACAVFERVGFVVTCVPATEHVADTEHPIDAADRLAAFRAYVYERLGWEKYRWRNWVR